MTEFTYSNYAPPAATDKNGKRMTNTNVVRIWERDGKIVYDRRYISKDGKVSESPIEHVFDDTRSPISIATMIHWGCCGWSANTLQINGLIEKVKAALEEINGQHIEPSPDHWS